MSDHVLLLNPNFPHTDSLVTLEPQDHYQFQWEQAGNLKLSVTGLSAPVDLILTNSQGQILQSSVIDAPSEEIVLNDLFSGPLFLEIIRRDRDTNYTLNFDQITGLPNLVDNGMSQDTPLNIEIVSGDKKDPELGIFSLEGMNQFVPNTPAYFQEAARRILSQSNWGQILISNANQPTSIGESFDWEIQVPEGVEEVQYRTSQPITIYGEKFGLMIVPKATIQEVWENPSLQGNNRPSFSFGDKTDGGFHFREETLGDGTLFTIEGEGGVKDNDRNETDIFVYIEKPSEDAIVPEPITPEPEVPKPVATEPEVPEPITPEPEVPEPDNNLEPLPSQEVEVPQIATPGENNIPPKDLRVTLENNGLRNLLTIAGTVSDRNGFSDIQRIELSVQIAGETWRAIASITDFTPNSTDDTIANFTYDWTEELGAGDYKIKAVAYDRAGKTSNVVIEQLTLVDTTAETPNPSPPGPPIDRIPPQNPHSIFPTPPISPILPTLPNAQPGDLRFSLFPLYTTGELLSFEGGKVYDADGIEDLNSIEFSIRKIGEDWIDAGKVTEFTQDAQGYGRFEFSYDLSNLTPGSYELRSVVYDRQGATSNIATEKFVMITDPGGDRLSDELKIDIAGAANLERYTPEELANIQKWVVWVTPGQSADDLAASVNAVNLGETGHIPNTYLWEFGDKPQPQTTPEAIANLLTEIDGVEFAYPEVPVPLKLMNLAGINEFKYPQWHLEDAVNPNSPSSVKSAWDIISSLTNLPVLGRNSVIGFVDDGVDYNHADLLPRYNPNLSFDFSDLDNDPFPRSQQKFEAVVSEPTIQGNRAWLAIPVNLTGLVNNVDFNLEFKGTQGLKLAADATFTLHSPTSNAQDPFDWQSFAGYWWRYPGWEESRSNKNKILPIKQGNKSVNIALEDHFNGIYAGGYWPLEISVNAYKHPDTTKFLQDLTNQIKSWSLDVTAINPHGTLVTGTGVSDGMRLSGVAPEADFAAIRLIGNIDPVNYSYDSEGYLIADALYDAKNSDEALNRNEGIDVFNNSWGPQYMRQLPLAIAALQSGSKFGRNGLGNSYVFSVGNDGANIGHVNYNNLANSRHVISVGAISRDGILSDYSTQAPFIVAYSDSGKPDNNGISTTATTLKDGMVTDFGGTSAAAPFVSGAIALMLKVNPNLTSRDIQHILAKTAYKTDPTHPDWQQNGGGHHINQYYGFGAVDPVAAVMAAKDWNPVGEHVKVTGEKELKNVLSQIRDGQKLTDAIAIDQDITVEHAEVLVNINHPDWKDLSVILKSPDGTESRLMNSIGDDPYGIGKTYEVHPGSNEWTFTSIRHWGESSLGEWTLEVYDEKGNQIEGEWLFWQLNLYGTEPVVTLEATQPNASEDETPGQFTVTRTGNNKNPFSVNYTIEGTATNSEDYQPLTGTVTIPGGQSSLTFNINPLNEGVAEEDETVILTVSEDSAYQIGSENSATVTITDAPPLIRIIASDPLSIENGNSGQFVAELLGEPLTTPLTINYTVSGTASNGIDYLPLTGTVILPAGRTMIPFGVVPIFDTETEGEETVQVTLTNSPNYNLGDETTASVAISDTTLTTPPVPTLYTNPANGHQYLLTQLDSWLGSQEQAQALGGNLVTINDSDEQKWLLETFGGTGEYWIGLMDSEIYGTQEGTFKWVDGSPIPYLNWHPSEPSNALSSPDGEDFVHTNHNIQNFPNQGKWNDLPSNYTINAEGVIFDISRSGIIEIQPSITTSANAYMVFSPEEMVSYLGLGSEIDPIKLAQFLDETYEGLELGLYDTEDIFVLDPSLIIGNNDGSGGIIIEPEILDSLKKTPSPILEITAEAIP